MMDALIAELEAATEGSWELDVAITKHVFPKVEHRHASFYMEDLRIEIQPYTTSLDAALTLVPKGEGYRMCTLLELYSDGTGNASVIPFVGSQIWSRKVATPALALCIAALRARQAMSEGE